MPKVKSLGKGKKTTAAGILGKIIPRRPKTTAASLFGKFIPRQPKLTPQRLFTKVQQALTKFGSKPKRIKPVSYQVNRSKKKSTISTKFTDTRSRNIFPEGNKPLVTHQNTFLRRTLRGSSEDPVDIMWIHLSANGNRFFDQITHVGIRARMVDQVATEMRRIHTNLLVYGISEVQRTVPKDTGLLRWSLITSMNRRLSLVPSTPLYDYKNLILRISFYTDLDYLKYVNSQTKGRTIRIAHHRSMRQRSRKTGEFLHDPDAKFGFMSLIRVHLKTRARQLTRTMISTLSRSWGMNYNGIKSLFKYRGYRFR